MFVVSAGLMRSGSTWLYNALRLILSKGTNRRLKADLYHQRKWKNVKHGLVKAHEFHIHLADKADFVFTSHRDIRDACASLSRFQPNRHPGAVIAKITEQFQHYQKWAQIADYDMQYEHMLEDPLQVLDQLASRLKLPHVDILAIYQELTAIAPPPPETRAEDPQTLLWPNHITDGRAGKFAETLDDDFVQIIEHRFGAWLRANGYLV
ncbi:hypothetical protein [Aeoliella sp.]|uniref:hypothetical protein n=1 Tax=Aeoliella sp. TaxID=2795800 RepID=UPI003CCC3F75